MPVAVFTVAWFRGEWGKISKYEEKWVGGDSQDGSKAPGGDPEINPPATSV